MCLTLWAIGLDEEERSGVAGETNRGLPWIFWSELPISQAEDTRINGRERKKGNEVDDLLAGVALASVQTAMSRSEWEG